MTGDGGTHRPTFRELRARMAQAGFSPRKARGQNFLIEAQLHEQIAAAAELLPGDVVLEIGTGLGFLTRALAATGAHVVTVEIDRALHQLSQALLAEDPPGRGSAAGSITAGSITALCADALAGDGLAPEVAQALLAARQRSGRATFAVVSNLPYVVAGPLLAVLCCHEPLPGRMVLLLQKEMADRVLAPPGSRVFGTLSALAGLLYRGRQVRKVPPGAFRPRPKVQSAVIRLDAIGGSEAPQPDAEERRRFARFLRMVFSGRRKGLRNALRLTLPPDSGPLADRALASVGILPSLRPEACSPTTLLSLLRALERVQAGAAPRGPGPEGPSPGHLDPRSHPI